MRSTCAVRMVMAFATALGLATPGLCAGDTPARPNIVFVFTDDHATQSIGAYGSRINETPRLDQLASQGTVFRNSFCANSICGPSRACILTGKHSHVNGFMRNGDRFDGDQTTFPKLLQSNGYQTALFGKWHLATDPTGFDRWEVLPGQGHYYNPDLIQMDGSRKRYEGYCTDIVTDLALEWLETGRDPDQPFLLMCQHKAPHRNWSPAPRHLANYEDVDIPEPATLFDDYSGRSSVLRDNTMSIRDHFHWRHDMKFKGESLFPDSFQDRHGNAEYARMTEAQKATWDAHYEPRNQAFIAKMKAGELSDDDVVRWKYQRYIKDYLRCIDAVDENVGRVLDFLDEKGLAENTLVIYSSDQGFYLGEHGWYDKRWMFEESLAMPLIARWPGVVEAGTESHALVQNIDYAPTFLELAGVDVPADVQGRSLLPVLSSAGETPSDWRDAVYYAYYESASTHFVAAHDGVRTGRHKLMHFPLTGEEQLFDLVTDPQEMRSVHEDPAYAGTLAALRKRLHDLRRFYDVNPATLALSRNELDWWRERHRAANARVKQGDVDLVFIGDSITQGWEGAGREVWNEMYADRKAVNLGFSGDRTEHVLFRLRYGNLAKITPKVAVVMIGTNNTGHRMQDPAEVAEGIRAILDLLTEKTPETQIVLLGVFPRGRSPHDLGRMNNLAINQIARRFADGQRIHYRDYADLFVDDEGRLPEALMPDALHLSAAGYRLWADALEPTLIELGLE